MPNYADSIFLGHALAQNCATDIFKAYAEYENSLAKQKKVALEDNEYNELVDRYNNLLNNAKEIAEFYRNSQEKIDLLQKSCIQVENEKSNLLLSNSEKDAEISRLKNLLNNKETQLNQSKVELDKLRETVFTFTLVNTILSTRATALKSVVNNWIDGNVYKKQSFINALKVEVKNADYAKNKIPATNSIEAFAYLESTNKPLFDKLKSLSL